MAIMGNFKFVAFVLLAVSLLACAGCESPQEEDGVSSIPFNRPATWEEGRGMGGALF